MKKQKMSAEDKAEQKLIDRQWRKFIQSMGQKGALVHVSSGQQTTINYSQQMNES